MARILFISTMEGTPWGGSEELWSQAAERLAKAGHKVFASVRQWPNPDPRLAQLASIGVTVTLRAWPEPLAARAWRAMLKTPRDPYRKVLNGVRPELVVISNGLIWPPLELVHALSAAGVPFITIGHAAHIEHFPDDETLNALRAFFQRARAVAFVSAGNRTIAETQIGEKISNAILVRNPLMVPFDIAPDWPDDNEIRLACVGRLHAPSKGQDLLLETLSASRWRDRRWTLSFYGEGPHAELLRRLAVRGGLAARISFRGFCKDIRAIWREHHALVLPSRYEGLPLVIVEAMLCHRPVITTDVAGNAEVLEDGVSGFVAETPTVKALGEALERAWQARGEWREYGLRAGQQIRDIVPHDPVGDFVRLLEELCEIPAIRDLSRSKANNSVLSTGATQSAIE